MRRIVIWIASTISGVVLLFSYHTSTNQGGMTLAAAPAVGSPPAGAGGNSGPGTGSSPNSSSGGSGSSSGSGSGTGGANQTVTGGAADTIFGPVQVRITVASGKIVSIQTPQMPMETSHDQRINTYAVPILNQEAIAAQSAHIDSVSGATYTSQGYMSSLQSAIDAAHLG